MIQINPREYFPIVRELEDPFDAGTYYIRAVVRNSKTNATIETVNLTDQGSNRFQYSWQAPADTSGQGLWIDVTTTVYTNSGYTTKSDVYLKETEAYLIAQRVNPFLNMGGGGSSGENIDYARIKKIFLEAVAKIEPAELFVNLEAVLSSLSDIRLKIENIKPFEKADFQPIKDVINSASTKLLSHISSLETKVSAIKIVPTNFTTVLTAIAEISKLISAIDLSIIGTDIKKEISENLKELKESAEKRIEMVVVNREDFSKAIIAEQQPKKVRGRGEYMDEARSLLKK